MPSDVELLQRYTSLDEVVNDHFGVFVQEFNASLQTSGMKGNGGKANNKTSSFPQDTPREVLNHMYKLLQVPYLVNINWAYVFLFMRDP